MFKFKNLKSKISNISASALIAGATFSTAFYSSDAKAEPFLGEISYFAGNFAPRGWMKCEGQLLPIAQNTALFSLLGTQYGGDGRTTFALPDMRGRANIHQGQGPGLSNYRMGQKGGSEKVQLSNANMPSQNLTANVSITANVTIDSALFVEKTEWTEPMVRPIRERRILKGKTGIALENDSVQVPLDNLSGEVTLETTSPNLPVDNIQPYTTTTCIIAVQGIYPSRS